MLRFLSRGHQHCQTQLLKHSFRNWSASSSNDVSSAKSESSNQSSSAKNTDEIRTESTSQKRDLTPEEELLGFTSKEEIEKKRRDFLDHNAEEMSTYECLTKMYLEHNANRYDAAVARHRAKYNNEEPLQRAWRVFKNDIKDVVKRLRGETVKKYAGTSDVLVIGNGITSALIAYYLKNQMPQLEVTLLEEDSMIGCEPLGVNGEGLIMQWDLPHYIHLAKFAQDFYVSLPYLLDEHDEDVRINFTPYSSLLLGTPQTTADVDARISIYAALEWQSEFLNDLQLHKKFPWLNLDGISCAVHGLGGEGWIDPWKVLAYVKGLCITRGVVIENGTIERVLFRHVDGVMTEDRPYGHVDTPKVVVVKDNIYNNVDTLDFSVAVIASGLRNRYNCWKFGIGSGPGYLQVPIPIKPAKRYMFRIYCPNAPLVDLPLVMDPSGVRIRREGFSGRYLCWREPTEEDEPDSENLTVDKSYFEEKIRPALVSRIPAFKNLKLEDSWAGFVDINGFDRKPILGPHPSYGNVHIVGGLGSNELVFGPGFAKATADVLIESDFTSTVNLSEFAFDRIIFDKPIKERTIVT